MRTLSVCAVMVVLSIAQAHSQAGLTQCHWARDRDGNWYRQCDPVESSPRQIDCYRCPRTPQDAMRFGVYDACRRCYR